MIEVTIESMSNIRLIGLQDKTMSFWVYFFQDDGLDIKLNVKYKTASF